MKAMTSSEIREAFLSYYASKGHERVASSSLIPQNDPTLLFTSAGMVQFKDVFTGIEKRSYVRATTAQRCLRAGGKHNDLENVGFTGRHHTFFEMMGNFSFGDYFKKEAIHYAWDLVTNVFGMPKDKLYVTVHISDDEAFRIWTEQEKVPAERIFRFDSDNFWSAGDVGPCGPCTEIFFNRGPARSPAEVQAYLAGNSGDEIVEFYNLVFMQFERDDKGEMRPLPKPSVDTGMGLERTTSILQGKISNYDTDVFLPILRAIAEASPLEAPKSGTPAAETHRFAMQVVADHLRAVSFLIADGLLPANDGRGYVLRRILRRAVRFGKKLGFSGPFLCDLVPALVAQLGTVHPILKTQEALVRKAIRLEEEKFFSTLEKGLALLQETIVTEYQKAAATGRFSGKGVAHKPGADGHLVATLDIVPEKSREAGLEIPGAIAFLLYDSHGFPLDLTQVIAQEFGFTVDSQGFAASMEKQRSLSKKQKSERDSGHDEIYRALDQRRLRTEFLGYESLDNSGKLLALIADGAEHAEITAGGEEQVVELVFDQAPLYPEGGGQVADEAELFYNAKKIANITHVFKPLGNLVVARAELLPGQSLQRGQTLRIFVPAQRRALTAANHSATHLLHWALRKTLGTHVKQAGSLVTPDLLRFDFTHMQALTVQEIEEIELIVNQKIAEASPVNARLMAKEDAIAAGALALFGEKYNDEVRVLKIGDFSTELCGGTHVENTSQIRLFTISSESGVAAGTRRIIALTSEAALASLRAKASVTDKLRTQMRVASEQEVLERFDKIQAHARDLEKKIERLELEGATQKALVALAGAKQINGLTFVSDDFAGSAGLARAVMEQIRGRLPSGVAVVAARESDKVSLVVTVSKDLSTRFSAGKIIQEVAPLIGGKGGGKPEAAQAGGSKPEAVPAALAAIAKLLSQS